MPYAISERISPHLSRTPEGYLLARNCVIARSGWQKYRGREIGIAYDDSLYDVFRPPEVVFESAAMASAESKAVTSPHPPVMLNSENTSWYSKGHVRNVHKGGTDKDGNHLLLGDLIITDDSLASEVLAGRLRQLSAGYSCDYNPQPDGTFRQSFIRLNHVAVVPNARGGKNVRIMDRNLEGSMDKIDEVLAELKNLTTVAERLVATRTARQTFERPNRLVAGANEVERLTASGCGPFAFADALRRSNTAYDEFASAAEAGRAFEEEARAMGQRQQAQYRPKGCTVDAPVRQHEESTD